MRCRGHREGAAALAVLVCALAAASRAGGQGTDREDGSVSLVVPSRDFLYRAGPGYADHSFADYTLPDFTHYSRVSHYGPMGDYLIKGYDAYSWRETRTNALTEAPRSLRTVPRWDRFERNVVATDSYRDWSASLVVGDEIRTLFTPLTLRLVGFDGVRLDSRTRRTALTAIGQRWMGPYPRGLYGQTVNWWFWDTADQIRDAAMLVGGHSEVEVGALKLGATGVNFHLFDSEQAAFQLRGDLQSTQVLPSFAIVRIADDSPEDERGGAVVNQARLYVNGQERPDLRPFAVKVSDQNPTAVGSANRLTGQFRRSVYDDGGTAFADVFYLQQHLSGQDVSRLVNLPELQRWVVPQPPGQWRADGHEVVLLFYDLRGEAYVRGVEAHLLVGNDFRVEALGLYLADNGTDKEELRWKVGGARALRRAPGNVQDLSNLDWVRLQSGQWTGRALWGVNGSYEAGNAKVRWEYTRSVEYRQYPDGKPGFRLQKELDGVRTWNGLRSQTWSGAHYVTAQWSGGGWSAGGELFAIDEDYYSGFVEDNDDNDRYPDLGAGHRPVPFWTAPSYDPDGVFPGKDEDHDGIPDTNRNGNDLPDYTEPFLRFEVEPDDYVVGADWNHNGVADEREDDLRPDYPYEVGQRGVHVYGGRRLVPGLGLTVGRLEGEGIGSGARNQSLYGRVGYERSDPDWGYVRAESLVQRLRDDVENPYQVFEETLSGSQNFPTYALNTVKDLLEWRDSVDWQHYAEGEWWPVGGLRLWGNARYRLNRQREAALADGSEQAADRLRLVTVVAKARYGFRPWPGWEVTGQCKGLVLRRRRESLPVDLADQWTLMPGVKVRYEVTGRTQVWLGLEGLPFWPLRVEDRAEGRNSLEEESRVVQLINRTPYYGYDIALNLGLQTRRRHYKDRSRAAESLDTTTLFMRVFLGFDE